MYTLANMQDSIKKVEATRAQRMATEPRRMTADEKDALLAAYHPAIKLLFNSSTFCKISCFITFSFN